MAYFIIFFISFLYNLTRKVSSFDSSETSFFWVAMMGCLMMTFYWSIFLGQILLEDLKYLILLCFLSTCGHFLLIKALGNSTSQYFCNHLPIFNYCLLL